jgi:nucleotide-binding universal stress UspA family protein
MSKLCEIVVGLDSSTESQAAMRWAIANVARDGRITVVHAVAPEQELALDAVLGDSVAMLRHRRTEVERWVEQAQVPDHIEVDLRIVEDHAATALSAAAEEVAADAVAVGHRAHQRFGPRLVGHVTADLLHRTGRCVVIVPDGWQPSRGASTPVVVGVGVSDATRCAIRWGMQRALEHGRGVQFVHAMGPRTAFRPDGLLDVVAYQIDPSIVPTWVEEDVRALADEISREIAAPDHTDTPVTSSSASVEASVEIAHGRIGRVLTRHTGDADVLVIGRASAPIRRRTLAPYLRHVIEHASCPVAIVPAAES